MAVITKEIEVVYRYTIHIEEENSIVQEYKDTNELIADLASYRFTILPVIDNGVQIQDVELVEWNENKV